MYLGHVMKAIWKRGSFLQRAVGNTKATLFSLKRPQEFLVTQPSCPSWWSSCQPWRASCHCPLCKWLWANEKAWNTLVGVQLEHFCQCGAVRLKSVSLWERCLLKTGPPATVVKNTFVWRRKCSQLSRICFFFFLGGGGHQTSVKKVNVKSTETENGWIDKKGFEKQNSGGAPGPQLSQSESHWKYLSYDMSSWNHLKSISTRKKNIEHQNGITCIYYRSLLFQA